MEHNDGICPYSAGVARMLGDMIALAWEDYRAGLGTGKGHEATQRRKNYESACTFLIDAGFIEPPPPPQVSSFWTHGAQLDPQTWQEKDAHIEQEHAKVKAQARERQLHSRSRRMSRVTQQQLSLAFTPGA